MNIAQYLTDLNINTLETIELISNYTKSELNFKQEGDCSITEILEHICISDEKTFALLKSESEYIADTTELYGDGKLKTIVLDYNGGPKITEMEVKELKGAVTDFLTFKDIFVQQRDMLVDALESGEIQLSNNTYDHLYLGAMTVTDWLNYVIYHTNRHLDDVKDSLMAIKKVA
jgi:iron uptake system EfeUOB component EfeO/EfeM